MPQGVTNHLDLDHPNNRATGIMFTEGDTGPAPSEEIELDDEVSVKIREIGCDLSGDEVNIFINICALTGIEAREEIMLIMNSYVLDKPRHISKDQTDGLCILFKGQVYKSRNALELYWETRNQYIAFGESVRTINNGLKAVQYVTLDACRIVVEKEGKTDTSVPLSLKELDMVSKSLSSAAKAQQVFLENLSQIKQRANEVLLSRSLSDMARKVSAVPLQTARILSAYLVEKGGVEKEKADRIAAEFMYNT